MRSRPALAAALLPLALLAACGDDDGAATDAAQTDAPSPDDAAAAGACDFPSDGQEPAAPAEPPSGEAPSGDVTATLELSQGTVVATLDAAATPCTVQSFTSLAEQGYFDGTECHRLTTQGIFVLQCGDPTGTGSGGPGYSFDDELTGSETYAAGTLAMANAGPNTNGSQFFVVYEDTQLPPAYTVFGSIDDAGLEVVQGIAEDNVAAGHPGDAPPVEPVEIESATIG